ncbi:MAG: hypothetical protein DLM63_13500 [Solirubrobacterales bacterium]|nr:MAG: hypothetical protein DLM63_13500 [Solirubrobacterales bacterium]
MRVVATSGGGWAANGISHAAVGVRGSRAALLQDFIRIPGPELLGVAFDVLLPAFLVGVQRRPRCRLLRSTVVVCVGHEAS